MHMIHKTLPTYEHDYTEDFYIQFRPLPEFIAYDTFSLTLKMDLTPIDMKTYTIKTNWSTKILTINLMIKLKVMI